MDFVEKESVNDVIHETKTDIDNNVNSSVDSCGLDAAILSNNCTFEKRVKERTLF